MIRGHLRRYILQRSMSSPLRSRSSNQRFGGVLTQLTTTYPLPPLVRSRQARTAAGFGGRDNLNVILAGLPHCERKVVEGLASRTGLISRGGCGNTKGLVIALLPGMVLPISKISPTCTKFIPNKVLYGVFFRHKKPHLNAFFFGCTGSATRGRLSPYSRRSRRRGTSS